MSKHTPGPWRVNPGAKEVRGADWNVIVADVTDEQDARLIAAAPDLLAACERLLRELHEIKAYLERPEATDPDHENALLRGEWFIDETARVMDEAAATIDKAKGETK